MTPRLTPNQFQRRAVIPANEVCKKCGGQKDRRGKGKAPGRLLAPTCDAGGNWTMRPFACDARIDAYSPNTCGFRWTVELDQDTQRQYPLHRPLVPMGLYPPQRDPRRGIVLRAQDVRAFTHWELHQLHVDLRAAIYAFDTAGELPAEFREKYLPPEPAEQLEVGA